MKKFKYHLLSLFIGLIFAVSIWQAAEPHLADFWGKTCLSIFGTSFMEVSTMDKNGVPMRYYPSAGKVYDPELIASKSSLFYKTRIEETRKNAFLFYGEWLEENLDANGNIPNNFDYLKAGIKKPWFSSASNSATMLALTQRAGYLRSPETFLKARQMLYNLRPEKGSLSFYDKNGGIWFQEFPTEPYSLSGMLKTLINLSEYHKLVDDSLSQNLFQQGVIALQAKLPELAKHNWLDDKYHYKNKRSEHLELTQLLEEVNSATPDSVFTPYIYNYQAKNRQFVLFQLISRPQPGRILGFMFAWAVLYLIAYLFLKPKKSDIGEL
ncbi:MAG: D-glucuronyl C5-epimerase family protein [Candidatus Cloacimonas sp.]|jgi:hypothetical protein